MAIRLGEYSKKGDYHIKLDKNWTYYPIYLEKRSYVYKLLSKLPKNKKILDIGCGEGALVKEFKKKGYNIIGMDINYESKLVSKGNITNIKFKKSSFDIALCLDVIEHLDFENQEKAFREIHRILKPNGILLVAVPNLAHFISRISFLLTGNLIRTSKIERHKGDRTVKEYKIIINKYFIIKKRKGIFPTYPISSILTYKMPSKVIILHKVLNKFFAYPNWCFLNIFVCQKKLISLNPR